MLRGCKDGNPLLSTRLTVRMDGMDIASDDPATDISLAFACMMAAYFVYGVQYPESIKNTMLFYEKYIFQLSSDTNSADCASGIQYSALTIYDSCTYCF